MDILSAALAPTDSSTPPTITPPVLFELSQTHTDSVKLVKEFDNKLGQEIKQNRKKRQLRINLDELRSKGLIDKDETFIKCGVIAKNVRRELVPYVNYLIQSPRIGVFIDPENPNDTPERLEQAFTSVVRYESYFMEWYKTLDGSVIHGKDAIEVIYDTNMPGKVRFEAVPAEDLCYPLNTRDIQDAPKVVRRYHYTTTMLQALSNAEGFSKSVIDRALSSNQQTKDTDDFIVYKVFMKSAESVVYVAWLLEKDSSEWLKAPVEFCAGVAEEVTITEDVSTIDPMTNAVVMTKQSRQEWRMSKETIYPYFFWIYDLTEDQVLAEAVGRAEHDSGKQEAQCALWSTFVNGANRSGDIYGSVDSKADAGAKVEALDVQLANRRLYNTKINFTSLPFPPMGLIDAAMRLDTATSEEIGQINFAANNRVDSRKTATEIQSAQQQNASLDSISVVNFAIFVQNVLNYAWRIVQSAAMRDAIKFCQILDPNTGMMVNDKALIGKKYIIKPAGDSDVIQKEQRLNNRLKVWPLVSGVPALAPIFLADILKEMFPTDGAKYEQLLKNSMQDGQFQQLATALFHMVEGLIEKPALHNDPDVQQAIPQLQQIKQQLMGNNTQ